MNQLKALLDQHNISYLENELLRNWTTFKIGGRVPLFIQPSTTEEISLIIPYLGTQNNDYFIIGRGSNLLFDDKDYTQVVLQLGQNFGKMEQVDDTCIDCQSGARLTQLCLFALEKGLSGLEPLYGIPGSVGGGVYMNAGAYGGEVKQVAVSSTYVDRKGQVGTVPLEGMELAYRHSVYTEKDCIITGLTVNLATGDPAEIKTKMDDFMSRRQQKQPLEHASGGSTFKRPEGHYASALIDECGLKGFRIGDAMVSEKHAGFVVNVGAATAKEVLGVIAHVQKEVLDQTGVTLEMEVIYRPAGGQ